MAQATTAELPTTVGVKRLATYGLLAVVLVSVVNGLVHVIALTAVDIPLVFALWWEPMIAASVVGAVGATVVYGGPQQLLSSVITRISDRPNWTFTLVAVIVLLLSFFGPVNAFLSPPPELADVPWTVFATLAIMHVTAAATIVGVVTGATNPEGGSR